MLQQLLQQLLVYALIENKWKVEVCIETTRLSNGLQLVVAKRLEDVSFFLNDSDGNDKLLLNADGRPYKDDVSVSVFL